MLFWVAIFRKEYIVKLEKVILNNLIMGNFVNKVLKAQLINPVCVDSAIGSAGSFAEEDAYNTSIAHAKKIDSINIPFALFWDGSVLNQIFVNEEDKEKALQALES
ncbi:MAG: hypothetical protein WDK96_04010 [Candidatus Paceibacterota bacterium]|jgi:hypothetical protein